MPMINAQDLIAALDLKPLPVEGGYFRETFRSSDDLPVVALPARYGKSRP